MKTLFINGKYLAQPVTGVQRYAIEIVKVWDEALSDGRIDATKFQIKILAPRTKRALPVYRNIRIATSWIGGKIWEQVYLPARTAGALLFSPFAAAPILKHRHLVTIHDAGVAATPEQYSFLFRTYNRLVYRILGITALHVITVSEFSKSELNRYFHIPRSKMQVVPLGYEQITSVEPDDSILLREGLQKNGFILGVSSRSPIKNFDALAAAWEKLARPDLKLVVAGGYNKRVFGYESFRGSGANITMLGYVSDAELRSLYQNARCFVYPSSYEGFGLPPVEAMACGCPVIVSNTSALPETCGEGALYCDPRNPADIATKMASVIDNPQFAERLRCKGRERIRQLSYRKCAETIWSIIVEHL